MQELHLATPKISRAVQGLKSLGIEQLKKEIREEREKLTNCLKDDQACGSVGLARSCSMIHLAQVFGSFATNFQAKQRAKEVVQQQEEICRRAKRKAARLSILSAKEMWASSSCSLARMSQRVAALRDQRRSRLLDMGFLKEARRVKDCRALFNQTKEEVQGEFMKFQEELASCSLKLQKMCLLVQRQEAR
mmetsp:Transcript_21967/g.34429  ORF Transcript_21967/g.34429 Transcript_21967/m.34429 type:complete len:191 (+) Transcript_21967:295-867(+)